MKRIPRMARGRRTRFFDAEGVDELLSMVLELTAEVYTLRERLHVTERVLERHGIPLGEAIEGYRLDEGDHATLAAERERLLSTVLRTLEAETVDDETVRAERDGAASAGSPDAERAA